MQIGKNRYTNSNKKAYRKPVLEVVEIDREIVLMQISDFPQNSSRFEPTTDTKKNNKIFNNSEDPFGGSTPDYEQ